jgi:hypothetical protein
MIKKILLIAVLTLLPVSIVWGAPDWLHFIDTWKGEKCYIDLNSIEHTPDGMIAVRRKLEPPNSPDVSSLVSNLEMDCGNSRFRVVKEMTYYKNGRTGTVAGDSTFRNVSAADFEESLMELVCSLKKRTR